MTAGSFVCTPIGKRRVLKSYVSGASETIRITLSTGVILRGTPHHKIYVKNKGLVPLSMLKCGDTLTGKTTRCQKIRLYIEALLTTDTRGNATTSQTGLLSRMVDALCIVRYGWMHMERFLMGITSITKTTIHPTMNYPILNAFPLEYTRYCTMLSAMTSEKNNSSGQTPEPGNAFCGKTWRNAAYRLPARHLRAAIVEYLLKQDIRQKSFAPRAAKRLKTGLSSIVKFVVRNFGQNVIKQEKSEPVHIVAVGRCEEKTPVFNLTVEEAHLFYAGGILSSNTDQEDHTADEVIYGCVSRPWVRNVEKKQAVKRDWFRFAEKSETNWRTV